VYAHGYPIGGDELSVTKGVVSRVELSPYFHSYKSFLNVQIDAALNAGNSGGPVIKDGKIAGVAFQNYQKAESTGYAIPPSIIRHFLNGIKPSGYRGFASLGVWWQSLENKAARTMLGMADNQSGVLALMAVYGTSAYGKILENDVILAIDGVKIANDGTVPLKDSGKVRVKFSHVVQSKYEGDKVSVSIIRDKKPMTVDVVLKREEEKIPTIEYDVKPDYYIFGGVVFTKLTGNFLREWGEISKSPIRLASKYYFDYMTEDSLESVFLLQVLADDTNDGYHDLNYLLVEAVNGQKIRDITDLAQKIENNKEKYLVVTLSDNRKLILDYEKSKKAGPEILKRYQIQSPASEKISSKLKAEK